MDAEMKFAWIPPGTFLMGENERPNNLRPERDREPPRRAGYARGPQLEPDPKPGPQHRITISKGFWMGIFPITQAQWRAVMGYNPSSFRGDDRPVEMVSWSDCQEFCGKMAQLSGKPIRLPTEAEWEYACRGGSTSEYWNGNGEDSLKMVGWYLGNTVNQPNSVRRRLAPDRGVIPPDGPEHVGESKAVGMLAANPWGLYDVHGNVWEWCQDWYGKLTTEDQTDPTGQSTGDFRVCRGGSYCGDSSRCLASCRAAQTPGIRTTEIGLRVCF
jgi:formylglycine-generating enzyme required for sulfatase activity